MLEEKLKQQYDIDCVVFLEDLEHSKSSTLYRLLSKHQQAAYPPNYRFLFFNFAPLDSNTLKHVTQTITYLDISPCFILLVTDQKFTAEYFQSVSDDFEIQRALPIEHALPNDKVKPFFNTNNQACAHGWAGLHVRPNGQTSLCCDQTDVIKQDDGQPYNIRQHSFNEILSSNYVTQAKNQFRQGQLLDSCGNCAKTERNNSKSKRTMTPYKLENIYGLIDWESNDPADSLGFIGGHIGNLCNLKCRICSPEYSSTIATEELKSVAAADIKHRRSYQLLTSNRWSKKSDDFWEKLKEVVPQICNFEFLGGEPLLLKENLDFMQYLVDCGHSKNTIFEFITNGTQYPLILNQADKFQRLVITLSIDNLGDRFEYERSGADWEVVVENINKFMQAKKNSNTLKIGVNTTVNIQNVLYLPELIDWFNQQELDYHLNTLQEPTYLSIEQLTARAKELVLDKLIRADLTEKDKSKLTDVITRIQQSTGSDGKMFCKKIKEKDIIRNENFSISHNDIANAMGYVL